MSEHTPSLPGERDTETEDTAMRIERLDALLLAYGASPAAWPPPERAAALALVGRSAAAAARLNEAAALDALLERARAPEPSRGLRARVLAAAPRGWPAWGARVRLGAYAVWPFGPLWRPALALMVAAVLGAVIGTVASPTRMFTADAAPVAEEIATLAFGPHFGLEREE
ncbi:MAG: hypothetical protein HY423_00570 [Candidatus Lambdaproteobacteria bacterium]|nr:hypothetical protein [Candidatus Lambdaproteobacteria bacterium]